jgi:hypothetical protein
MKNKKKAKEIAIRLIGGDRNIQPLVDALIEMAEWKDEQFAIEKQQLIENACEWVKSISCCGYIEDIKADEFIEDFKKAMNE